MASTTGIEKNEVSMDEAQPTLEEAKEDTAGDNATSNGQSGGNKDEKNWRAKLYKLNADGGWDDLGTGYCYVNRKEEKIILVEEDGKEEILSSKIELVTNYHRQRDTIITWTDEVTTDLAISFQENEGAQETWEILCNIQGKDPEEVSNDDESDDERLPEAETKNLTTIHKMLQNLEPTKKEKVIETILKDNSAYLASLKQILEELEKEKDILGLVTLFLVFKDLVNIANITLLETLLSDKFYETVFGALEYNNEIYNDHKEMKHRKFLKSEVKFKTLVAIEDEETLNRIHLNYRISYLKDTALATGLEEGNLQLLNNVINANNQLLIETILLDKENITMIFESLRNDDVEKRKEAIAFISELFSISKNLQLQGRLNLMSTFKNIEGYNLITFVCESLNLLSNEKSSRKRSSKPSKSSEKLVNNSLDILFSYLQAFPVNLPELCESTAGSDNEVSMESLIKKLISTMLKTSSQGIMLQINELLKFLIESGELSTSSIIFESGLKLIAEFLEVEEKEGDSEFNNNLNLGKSLGLELITKAIHEDNYSVRSEISSLGLIEKVCTLTKFNNKLLNIAVIKFYKMLIHCNFRPYIAQMIRSECLDNVIKIYEGLPNKRNMTGSIVLEMFSKINKLNFYQLAHHLCERFEVTKPFLEQSALMWEEKNKTSEIEDLLQKYDKNEEEGKLSQGCFDPTPNFEMEIAAEKFERELKPGCNSKIEFTPECGPEIMLESDEVLQDEDDSGEKSKKQKLSSKGKRKTKKRQEKEANKNKEKGKLELANEALSIWKQSHSADEASVNSDTNSGNENKPQSFECCMVKVFSSNKRAKHEEDPNVKKIKKEFKVECEKTAVGKSLNSFMNGIFGKP